jgi:hypothetical protein
MQENIEKRKVINGMTVLVVQIARRVLKFDFFFLLFYLTQSEMIGLVCHAFLMKIRKSHLRWWYSKSITPIAIYLAFFFRKLFILLTSWHLLYAELMFEYLTLHLFTFKNMEFQSLDYLIKKIKSLFFTYTLICIIVKTNLFKIADIYF